MCPFTFVKDGLRTKFWHRSCVHHWHLVYYLALHIFNTYKLVWGAEEIVYWISSFCLHLLLVPDFLCQERLVRNTCSVNLLSDVCMCLFRGLRRGSGLANFHISNLESSMQFDPTYLWFILVQLLLSSCLLLLGFSSTWMSLIL